MYNAVLMSYSMFRTRVNRGEKGDTDHSVVDVSSQLVTYPAAIVL